MTQPTFYDRNKNRRRPRCELTVPHMGTKGVKTHWKGRRAPTRRSPNHKHTDNPILLLARCRMLHPGVRESHSRSRGIWRPSPVNPEYDRLSEPSKSLWCAFTKTRTRRNQRCGPILRNVEIRPSSIQIPLERSKVSLDAQDGERR